jgi:hypothetical protein
MSSIKIKIEFTVGTNIKNAVREAGLLAKKINVAYVAFNFNGVRCNVSSMASSLSDEAIMQKWNCSLCKDKIMII